MGIIDIIRKPATPDLDADEQPKIVQNKTYTICIENNPNRSEYKYCGKKSTILIPDCKLTLTMDGLTSEQLRELEIEVDNLLERNEFKMR